MEYAVGLQTGSYATFGENIAVSFMKDKLSGMTSFEQFRTDGYRVNSDLLRNDLNGKVEYAFSDSCKSFFSFGNHEDEYGLAGALLDIELNTRDRRASVKPDDYGRTRDYFFAIGLENDFSSLGTVQVDIARRKRSNFSDFVASSWITERNTTTDTANIKYTIDTDLLKQRNKVIAGIDYFDAEQDVLDGAYSGNPDLLTLSKKTYGFYITDQLTLTDQLSLNVGHRYDSSHYTFEQETSVLGSDASSFKEKLFTVGLNYTYHPYSHLYLNYSDSFRLPLVDEVYTSKYSFFGFSGGGLNVALAPQKAKNYEIGVRHSFNKSFSAGLTGYLMKIKDEIYYEPTTLTNTTMIARAPRGRISMIPNSLYHIAWDTFYRCLLRRSI